MSLILTIRNAEAAPEGVAPRFEVEGEGAVIGRSKNCDWNLPDPDNIVSSRHAEIRRGEGGWVLKDISTNGTFLNGSADRMAGEHVLKDGDVVAIGRYQLVAAIAAEAPAPEPTPELPQIRERIVAIPDPTPDEPEPIRPAQVIEPEIELPTDVIIEIPEGPPPVEPTGPVPVGGDVTAPVKVHTPKPRYTEIARKVQVEGLVIVQAVIDKQGRVVDVEVLKGLPMGLDQAAVDAVRQWRFEPATLNGKPVDVYYSLSVTFTLN